MTAAGRPLRFLIGLMTLWVGVRVAQLWPREVTLPTLVAAAIDRTAEAATRVHPKPTMMTSAPMPPEALAIAPPPIFPVFPGSSPQRPAAAPHIQVAATPHVQAELRAQPTAGGVPSTPSRLPSAPAMPPRFAGSGWLIVRSGSATPFAPQLGGSQAGVRLIYAIDAARRLALAGRFSSALGMRQREAAIGIDWRPTALPLHIVAEQRIGVDGMRGGPAVGIIGGIGPTPLLGTLKLDSYVQGGAIARDGVEGYLDGAVRVAHPVAAIGPIRVELGVGAWGAAQRGAARLDAGPSASLALPIAGRGLRLSLDWRQRLAGDAAPASGPALSLGTDF